MRPPPARPGDVDDAGVRRGDGATVRGGPPHSATSRPSATGWRRAPDSDSAACGNRVRGPGARERTWPMVVAVLLMVSVAGVPAHTPAGGGGFPPETILTE